MKRETLDEIARSDAAVFAIDRSGRVVVWNHACEKLLGYSCSDVLGKFCFDVLIGRDGFGNLNCHRLCTVVHHLRFAPNEPLQRFSMTVPHRDGSSQSVSVTAYPLDAQNPRLTVIVHVIAPEKADGALLRQLDTAAQTRSVDRSNIVAGELTAREREILCAIAGGMSTDQIAAEFCIARVTVRNHVRNILQKLGVHTKLAAVAYAFQNQLVTLENENSDARKMTQMSQADSRAEVYARENDFTAAPSPSATSASPSVPAPRTRRWR